MSHNNGGCAGEGEHWKIFRGRNYISRHTKKSAALQSTRLCYTIVNSFTAYLRESGLLFDFEEPWTTVVEEEFKKAGSNPSLHNLVGRSHAFSGITQHLIGYCVSIHAIREYSISL